jgi:arsenite methyltransferase
MKQSTDDIKQAVKKHYGAAITQSGSCCGPSKVNSDAEAAGRFARMAGYTDEQLAMMPEGVTSFGCGNPVNFIDVKKGDVVLDLGSGAGLDLILASRKVGAKGKVIGLDMTPEMIETSRRNLKTAEIKNAEVRLGEMENMPVADGEVDWIISNCVINLSPEKEKVFAEAFRVLKPGGRMLVSDIVTQNLSAEYRDDIMAWVGCIAGAVEEAEYLRLVKEAGFVDVKIVDKMTYDADSLGTLAEDACGCSASDRAIDRELVEKFAGRVASIKLSARKPQ